MKLDPSNNILQKLAEEGHHDEYERGEVKKLLKTHDKLRS